MFMAADRKSERVSIEIEGVGTVRSAAGLNLREALRGEGVFLDGTCGDRGDCGGCVVTVLKGDAGEPDESEAGVLGPDAVENGSRLACRVTLSGDLKIIIDSERLLELDITGRWKETWGSVLWENGRFVPGQAGYGMAVDLGTTSIAAALFDMETGRPLDVVSFANPLIPWGEDIITRLQAYASGTETSSKMRAALWNGLSASVRKLSSRNGLSPDKIGKALFVGNPAIHHIALGLQVKPLLEPPFGPVITGAAAPAPGELGLEKIQDLPEILVFPPPLGGFVGSDILVSLPAAMEHGGASGAMVDIGTNCEIAIWKDERILVTSVAAGPAFEGGEILNGMRAEEGAIYRVRIDKEAIKTQVVGGGEPIGICGTGIVDTVSEMVRLGLVDSTGLFQKGSHPLLDSEGLHLDRSGGVIFTPGDVEAVQKAKSAVSAAMAVLAGKAGIALGELAGIYISGAFGSRLDVKNAIGIGLLPDVPEDRFVLSGNAALVGVAYCLLSEDFMKAANGLVHRVDVVSAADEADFEELFLENLFFGQYKGRGFSR